MNPLKYAQMMKYLTRAKKEKPNLPDVFPASQAPIPPVREDVETMNAINAFIRRERQQKAGGGMLVQPSADGSRPGYAEDDRFIRTEGSGKQKSEEMIKFLNYATNNKNKIKNKTLTEIIEASGANVDKSNARKRLKENKIKIGTADQSTIQKTKQLTKEKPVFDGINNFAKNWINKNQKKYGVTEYDKFISDFANDWQKELNKPLYKNYTGDRILSNPDGTPKTNTLFGKQETGFTINGLKPPNERTSGLFYKRVFYKNKLKNKDFKKKVNNYLDWVLQDKRGKGDLGLQGGGKSNYLKAAQKVGLDIDKDVLYFFGEVMQGDLLTAGEGFYSIVDKEIGGNKASKYKNKLNISYQNWINNIEEVSKLAGVDPKVIINNQLKEAKKMTALFGLEKLPFEFRYAQDHLFGLAEAKALGDPRIAKQTLTNLVASTKEQNTILGTKGFSAKRTALMRKFKNALPEEKINIINQLNTLSQEYVPGRLKYSLTKDDALRITNLQPEGTFKARTEAYKNLAKDFPKPLYQKLMKFCPKSNGGAAGTCTLKEAMDGLVSESKQLQSGNMNEAQAKKTAQKIRAVTRVGTGSTLAGLLGPYGVAGEVVIDGAIMANRMLDSGDTYKEALSKSLIKYAMPKDARERLEKETDLNTMILGTDTKGLAADYASALEKDKDLQQKYENYLKVNQEGMSSLQDPYSSGTTPMFSTGDKNKAERELIQALERAEPAYGKSIYETMKFGSPEQQAFATKQEVFDAQKMQNRMDYDRRILGPLKDLFGTGFYSPEQLKQLELKADRDTELIGQMSEEDKMQRIANFGGVANLAGGGIAKLAGVDSGPPPESGPNSQGLQGLMKRVRN